MPITPQIELISTIRPLACERICGRTACTTRTQPQKFVSNCAFASAIVGYSAAPATPQPAAATSASMRPARSMTPPMPVRTAESLSTSMTRPVQPADAVPRRLDPVTDQPAAASRSAQALPIPADAPVTIATRGASAMSVLVPLAGQAAVGGPDYIQCP